MATGKIKNGLTSTELLSLTNLDNKASSVWQKEHAISALGYKFLLLEIYIKYDATNLRAQIPIFIATNGYTLASAVPTGGPGFDLWYQTNMSTYISFNRFDAGYAGTKLSSITVYGIK